MSKLVRLKPYDPKRGHVMRSYTAQGHRIIEGRGWYELSDSLAKYLSGVRQQPVGNYNAEDAPLAFDVCSQAEAQEIDRKEAQARARQVGTAGEPLAVSAAERSHSVSRTQARAAAGTMTTSDLPVPSKPKPSPSFDAEPGTFEDDMAGSAAPTGPVEPDAPAKAVSRGTTSKPHRVR